MSIKEKILKKAIIIEDFEKTNNKNPKSISNNNDIKRLSKRFKRRHKLKMVYLLLFSITIILTIMFLPILLIILFEL